jgi:hypothetical protein
MSNYHVLTQSRQKKSVDVVWHIPVSNTNNSADVNYRTALVDYLVWTTGNDPILSDCPNITPAELTQIEAGELYELRKSYTFSRLGLTNGQKATELDAKYTSLATTGLTRLQTFLEWFGLNRDV